LRLIIVFAPPEIAGLSIVFPKREFTEEFRRHNYRTAGDLFMNNEFDIVVIGSGHNALTTAAYLQKSNLRVAVIERLNELGGGLSSVELYPGYYFNNHAMVHNFGSDAQPIRDLNVREFGGEYITPAANIGIPYRNGKSVVLYSDVNKTCNELARRSKADSEMYAYFQKFEPMVMAHHYSPALPDDEWRARFVKKWGSLGEEYFDFQSASAFDVVDQSFEEESIKLLLLLSVAAARAKDVRNGTGFVAMRKLVRGHRASLVKGSVSQMANAFGKLIQANGGEIITGHTVKKIDVKDGTAQGVYLDDDRYIKAKKAVISGIDPAQTYLKLVGKDNLDGNFAKKIGEWKWNDWTLFVGHALCKEPPHFTCSKDNPDFDKTFQLFIGYETIADLQEHWQELARLEPPKSPRPEGWCFTTHDQSQGPGGYHTLTFSQFVPYNPRNQGSEAWKGLKDAYLDANIVAWTPYAPNIKKENVVFKTAITPYDVENRIINMVHADAHQGGLLGGQIGVGRQSYRAPVKNLYLCGACCHPGGTITFAPGYICANIVAEDLGIKKWWPMPEYLKDFTTLKWN
jgi:phytoene dehydrogenase-like protein